MASRAKKQNGTAAQHVIVRGAREHNLKGVDLDFPRDALVTFTGVSGSGKSSLAYHTVYQEGQRRFLESLSSYARQFLGKMEKPRVEKVDGLSPTVSIDQKSVGHSPRSTVGTLTEVLDFMRLLFARLGSPVCPECGAKIESWSVDRIVKAIVERFPEGKLLVLAPVVRERKGEYRQELASFRSRGFVRARIDGQVRRLDEDISLHRYKYHTIELVVDRLRIKGDVESRLAEAIEQAIALADGLCAVMDSESEEYVLYSTQRACPEGHGSIPEIEPRLFSFNSPMGACPTCDGLGEHYSFSEDLLIKDPKLSIRDGALHGFTADGRLSYSKLGIDHLGQVGDALGFDLDTPWRKLTAKARKIVMYGSGARKFDFQWQRGGSTWRSEGSDHAAWPGLVRHLENAYRNATSRHLDRFRAATTCPDCEGTRLGPMGRSVSFEGEDLPSLVGRSVDDCLKFFAGLKLSGNAAIIGRDIVREIELRLQFLTEVGLGYLSLERRANTLSGGESQRIRLAAQVGAGLRGILYVLDEPSIGLHPRDQQRLLGTLRALRDRGNTVCVVEHDEDTMLASDFLVDIGPGAGRHGGEVVAAGPPAEVADGDSITAKYLRGEAKIEVPAERRPSDGASVWVRGARHHNLKDIDVRFPLGCLVVVTGVSGSGKSTLVDHVLKRALRRQFHGAHDRPGEHDTIEGLDQLDKIVEISQSPIGRTPRSNPATYTGLWDHVRDLFAKLPESRVREYKKGRFSFNVAGGRCESCEGAGVMSLEMQFLAPVEIECDDCGGQRFNPETLEIRYRDLNVAQILDMTVEDACELFQSFPKIARPLETLRDVGLGYVKLGQPSTTLSGGEAQRVKLATELHRPATGRTIYLCDEPTTGLHTDDVGKLLACLQRLVDSGNTVVVIEHNLDVIKSADWLLDMGPEGGPGGGTLIAEGTPEDVVEVDLSHTGQALRGVLKTRRKKPSSKKGRGKRQAPPTHIEIRGARQNNLREVDVDVPIDKFTVVTGVSGSGKTSLAFDTLFSEGQRRFVESLSTYARRYLGRLDRAPVDRLDGLGPAIAIDQRASSRSPRSTVATATEIHDYLRLLYARIGRPHCPDHGGELQRHAPSQIASTLVKEWSGKRGYVLAPIDLPESVGGQPKKKRVEYLDGLRGEWREAGFVRALVDGEEHRLDDPIPVPRGGWPELHLVVDRVAFRDRSRLVDSAAQAAELGLGRVVVRATTGDELVFTVDRSCPQCGHRVPENPHPRYFSFNHHSGACESCSGLGRLKRCVPELLVNHPRKPLFVGAIQHKGAAFTFLTKRTGWYATIAKAVAREYGFDLSVPFDELSEEARDIMLYGCDDERFDVVFRKTRRQTTRKWETSAQWKGLATQIEEWAHSEGQTEHAEERYSAVMREAACSECGGERLGRAQRHVTVGSRNLSQFTQLTVKEAREAITKLRLRKAEKEIAHEVLREIDNRLSFLDSVGLGYLTLDRSAATLSGGEAQRIRLATQLGNRLVGVLYVLDEPTVGLHPRDTEQLLHTLQNLRDLGNTVVAIEHDEAVIRAADHVIDIGPGAGHRGGRVVAAGTAKQLESGDSLTGRYLRGELAIGEGAERREARGSIGVRGANAHNLKDLDVDFPLGVLTAVTGVSGSGKSSLVLDSLLPQLLDGEAEIDGSDELTPIVVDQSPIGTTPSSNPATYTGILTPIREFYAQLPGSKVKGFKAGRFSFNVAGGRCDSCEGKGQIKVEMHFLADVWVTCEVCRGRRFNAETLSVDYRGKSIGDVLEMEVVDALEMFGNHKRLRRPLQLLVDVGLGYLKLGQAANTLSGGEAQRIKLVAQLAKPRRGHNLYLLDEPTTGLHMDDVAKLVTVLQRLVERGDTVIVIEHHLDVIRCADHVVELGPEAGAAGGSVIASGTPEEVVKTRGSHTAPFLRELLKPATKSRPKKAAGKKAPTTSGATKKGATKKSARKKAGRAAS